MFTETEHGVECNAQDFGVLNDWETMAIHLYVNELFHIYLAGFVRVWGEKGSAGFWGRERKRSIIKVFFEEREVIVYFVGDCFYVASRREKGDIVSVAYNVYIGGWLGEVADVGIEKGR